MFVAGGSTLLLIVFSLSKMAMIVSGPTVTGDPGCSNVLPGIHRKTHERNTAQEPQPLEKTHLAVGPFNDFIMEQNLTNRSSGNITSCVANKLKNMYVLHYNCVYICKLVPSLAIVNKHK